jgi:hypothetical protein
MAISSQNRARFEGIGLDAVRHELGVGYVKFLIGDEQRQQAAEWLVEQDAKAKKDRAFRKRVQIASLIVSLVAAIAAVIAAWPVIKDWLRLLGA